ncbi:MAG: hypothetical protein ABRQ26_11090 [Syntrophomonadaceae bacterium]
MSNISVYPDSTDISTKKIVVVWVLLLGLLTIPFLYRAAYAALKSGHVNKGEYATCSDIWGDRFDIAVKDVSSKNGILTLSLLVNYNLVDKTDEGDTEQTSAAMEVFLMDSSYIQNGLNTVNCMDSSQGITSYVSTDDKTAVVNMKFSIDNAEGSTFVVQSYQGIDNFSKTQINKGIKASAAQIKFELQ